MAGASLEKREEVIDRVLEETRMLVEWPHAGQVEIWMEGRSSSIADWWSAISR
jgi:hypothetical protein